MTKSDRQVLALYLLNAPRCGAKTKRNNHEPCRGPAMPNGRCRLHGGKSTGPRTEDGKRRSYLAHTKHGLCTNMAKAERRRTRELLKDCREDLAIVNTINIKHVTENVT